MYSSYTYEPTISSTTADAGVFAAIAAMMGIIMIPALIISVVAIIAQFKIFKKFGQPGWKAIIPVYNIITLLEAVNINPLFILVALIPVVGSIAFAFVMIIAGIRLCKGMGKDTGFIVGYFLLSFIFMLILAFDKSTWDESRIDMNMCNFLNKNKDFTATPNAGTTANTQQPTQPTDPWVNGQA